MSCMCGAERCHHAGHFWGQTKRVGDCWEWQGAISDTGYGAFRLGPKLLTNTHRYAYHLANRRIPEGMFVLHHCDNPPCVRPSHLFLGTAKDNNADLWAKGRGHVRFDTHCQRGHELTTENIGMWSDGGRYCRACYQAAQKRRYARR